jgi:hypothetical protein
MGMTSDEAFSSIFAKSVEQAKASAEIREKDIESNGLYWYGKALEYKQMHEMAVKREQHLEGMLKDRTTERDYHLRMADLLAERIRAFGALEDRFVKVLEGWEDDSSSPAAVSALQFALGAVRDAKYHWRKGDGVAECPDWKDT